MNNNNNSNIKMKNVRGYLIAGVFHRKIHSVKCVGYTRGKQVKIVLYQSHYIISN